MQRTLVSQQQVSWLNFFIFAVTGIKPLDSHMDVEPHPWLVSFLLTLMHTSITQWCWEMYTLGSELRGYFQQYSRDHVTTQCLGPNLDIPSMQGKHSNPLSSHSIFSTWVLKYKSLSNVENAHDKRLTPTTCWRAKLALVFRNCKWKETSKLTLPSLALEMLALAEQSKAYKL